MDNLGVDINKLAVKMVVNCSDHLLDPLENSLKYEVEDRLLELVVLLVLLHRLYDRHLIGQEELGFLR